MTLSGEQLAEATGRALDVSWWTLTAQTLDLSYLAHPCVSRSLATNGQTEHCALTPMRYTLNRAPLS